MAIPVLFLSGGSSIEVDATVTAGALVVDDGPEASTSASTAASSLLRSVDPSGLLDAGADTDAALAELEQDSATSVVSPTVALASPSGVRSPGGSAAFPAHSPTTTAAPTTAAPTTAAPTTAAPTTAVPATAAPTTADPAMPAPTTAVPATPAPTTATPTTAVPATAAPTTAAPTTAVPATAAPTVDTEAAEAPSGTPTTEQWAALRQCESFGDYTIVSANGAYHGAYQFNIGTWDSTATSAGRGDLVGVLPSQASPSDQDAMALHLWQLRGWNPWPHCSRSIG